MNSNTSPFLPRKVSEDIRDSNVKFAVALPNPDRLEEIINAILYEGYILYPYRASSPKNQRERFTFGRVYPADYSASQDGAEPHLFQAECLLKTKSGCSELEITLGFLQPVLRRIAKFAEPLDAWSAESKTDFEFVPTIELDGKIHQSWTEAVERKVSANLKPTPSQAVVPFSFDAGQKSEPITDAQGKVIGLIVRQSNQLGGLLDIRITPLQEQLFKVTVIVDNRSPISSEDLSIQENVILQSFTSTHFAMKIHGGEFISLLETPDELKPFAEGCKNVGVWPVLVGDQARAERHAMLASPIILYDFPQIAPQSAGNFFDGTEIDEMLTLRVLTMTDAEKREMQVDDFSRQLLERTHGIDAETFLRLHGVMQPTNRDFGAGSDIEEFLNPLRPIKSAFVDGRELKAGDRVIICPQNRADAMDLVLRGKTAVIEALEEDAEGEVHLAVVIEDDPGYDLGLARQSGHRFFYRSDEVKPLTIKIEK